MVSGAEQSAKVNLLRSKMQLIKEAVNNKGGNITTNEVSDFIAEIDKLPVTEITPTPYTYILSKPVADTTTTSYVNNDIKGIEAYLLYNSAFSYNKVLTTVGFPNLEYIKGGNNFRNTFEYCTNLVDVDFSKLTTITGGNYVFANAFTKCENLLGFPFTNLRTIGGDNSFYYTYVNAKFVNTDIVIPVETIISGSSSTFQNAFEYSNITSLSFPNLTSLQSSYPLRNIGSYCSSLTSISFPELQTISNNSYACYNMISNSPNVKSVSFPKLTSFGSYSLYYTFSGSSIEDLYFGGLTSESNISNSSFQFVLSSCKSEMVRVHFPADMETKLRTFSYVVNGLGLSSSKVTLLFDL